DRRGQGGQGAARRDDRDHGRARARRRRDRGALRLALARPRDRARRRAARRRAVLADVDRDAHARRSRGARARGAVVRGGRRMTTGAWALVPARSFRTGKSRLGSTRARAAVARALFDRVVGVLASTKIIDGVLVLTDGGDVISAARSHGADVLIDPPDAPPLASII